uniref:Uncharacterized protein n=1 Tax=Siphoviridae sp. ctmpG14 TaxID=2825654 RepID=A0A8S5PC93_9CAUD|nr:MAG TPA: hypothetical protein [Siphoviridae sp. ctmpG14]
MGIKILGTRIDPARFILNANRLKRFLPRISFCVTVLARY